MKNFEKKNTKVKCCRRNFKRIYGGNFGSNDSQISSHYKGYFRNKLPEKFCSRINKQINSWHCQSNSQNNNLRNFQTSCQKIQRSCLKKYLHKAQSEYT